MMKSNFLFSKFVLGVLFLLLAPVDIFLAIFSLNCLSSRSLPVERPVAHSAQLYTALPPGRGSLQFNIVSADARPVIIRQYLAKYNSPLEPYADLIFQVSQQYNLDYRLLVAIAQQESNLGKKIPANSYNAWGWGIHSKGTLKFPSWEKAIRTVARGLRENYLDKGLTTPEEIMRVYTPLSNGSWAFGVRQFMTEME